jgi:hypothetical protein
MVKEDPTKTAVHLRKHAAEFMGVNCTDKTEIYLRGICISSLHINLFPVLYVLYSVFFRFGAGAYCIADLNSPRKKLYLISTRFFQIMYNVTMWVDLYCHIICTLHSVSVSVHCTCYIIVTLYIIYIIWKNRFDIRYNFFSRRIKVSYTIRAKSKKNEV